jgi:hypothetical protein
VGSVGLLILGSIFGAVICAKARVAMGAVLFSLVALVLFIATPVGQGLPGAVSGFMSAVDNASTPALNGSGPQEASSGAAG